ncbi:hypothetical protein FRC10_004593 [Ceratobasidium sp. 414]|nr:hypothetical protein FRC10_004593 [Ceratobasidium sp. 414]
MNDYDAAQLFYRMARIARDPDFQDITRKIKDARGRKPEWGRPIREYIRDVISPDYGSPVLARSLVQNAIDSVQLNKRGLPRPTCETFRAVLGLIRDPANLPMLSQTKVLSSCIHLLREHVKDTQEPVFCYEYGYVCFQVMVLTIQVAILTRKGGGGFETFMTYARACTRPQDFPTLLALQTVGQIHISDRNSPNASMSWILETSPAPQGRRIVLPAVGGLTDLDNLFLIKTLWESRKQLSYIGSKAATPGWSIVMRIFSEHLFEDIKIGKVEPVMWGYLETLCHRYGIITREEEVPLVADICSITGDICAEANVRHHVQTMQDEEDARTVVESYIARMTPRPEVELLPIDFCATLVDFVFQEEISVLGDLLLPLVGVGFERVWLELADEKVVRDVEWCVSMAQVYVSNLGATERLFGAEHKFHAAEIEAFVRPLHDIGVVGFLGQAILLPTNLPPDALAAKLFADEYSNWLATLNHIRLQILNNPSTDESLRGNAPGVELAWTNVGKIFGFTERSRADGGGKGLPRIRIEMECANPRCARATGGVVMCGGCMESEEDESSSDSE